MNLLALDTATEQHSAAVVRDGQFYLSEARSGAGGSDQIMQLVETVLRESGTSLPHLEAIAFGRGPGAFTGVRLAASICQGLAYAASLPVIAVSTLRTVAQRALGAQPGGQPILVCQDARMGEVYWGLFTSQGGIAVPAGPEAVGSPASVAQQIAAQSGTCVGAGSGFDAYPELAGLLGTRLSAVQGDCQSHAREVARLAQADGLTAAVTPDAALPVYVRNRVVHQGHP